MATIKKLISDVRAMHKMLSSDNSITDRVIASEIINSSLMLIKRESNLRKLWGTDTIFTTINCLEMIEVPITDCTNYFENITVARSKERLPSIAEGNYQYLIQGVYSINVLGGKGTKLKEITINRYLNIHQLKIRQENYYWIANNYLYTNNFNVQSLRISALFNNLIDNKLLYSTGKCGENIIDSKDYCKNPLDREYNLPGYLQKQMLDMVSQKLMTTYFRLKTDVTQEGIDGQAINTKPTN